MSPFGSASIRATGRKTIAFAVLAAVVLLDARPARCSILGDMLRSIEDMSTEETAECLDLSLDVVKTRLHRARGLLRRELLARAGTSVAALYAFAGARCDRIVAAVLARVGREPVSKPS